MKKLLTLAFITTFLSLGQAQACDMHGKTGIVADNDLWISVHDKNASGITEADFNAIIDRAEKIYAPIIKALGKTLEVERKWTDGTVNAYARQVGEKWMVSMFGGLARHETITADAFALVVCHELGHHLGGAPKKSSWFGSSWASNEGQADFWGNAKCMKKYFEEDDNVTIASNMEIDAEAKAKCDAQFSDAEQQAMCYRGSMAGLSLGNLFRALRRLQDELKFTTPDANIVSKTNHNHPAPQCRLDTYFQGTLCTSDPYTDVSNTDPNLNICNREAGDTIGIRPLCWYKPATN